MAFYYAINGVMIPYLPLLFQQHGFNYRQIGILLTVGPVVNVLTQFLWGYLCDKIQTVKKLLLLQLFMSAGISLLVFYYRSFWPLVLALTAFYIFYRPIPSLIDTLILNGIKENPSKYGNYRLFGSLGFMLSVFTSGYLLNKLGVENSPVLITLLLVITFFCALPVPDAKYICAPPNLKDLIGLVKTPAVLTFLTAATFLGLTHLANDNFITVHLKSLGGTVQ